ncbi:uncharacterized protein LOC106175538 [Lingula anatina]|uniref:Uncharacterized protein LOC106175538 n=1 Tax=Lingula anatina TaxID=7574 RepID=A0A1S3JRP2_LINAN|nr:uncharacterized protein LOC106175538 [Lingula anatina]|eukprot:XP_013413055.1 uncharacterized protein LOC106175538 [Lingula anatina]
MSGSEKRRELCTKEGECRWGWECDDGACIDSSNNRCDSVQDCPDNSDEVGCGQEGCNGFTHYCNSSESCVRMETQCSDGKCADEWLPCKNSAKCIPKWRRCNGVKDCEDNSDETECDISECDGSRLSRLGYCNETRECRFLVRRCSDGSCPGGRLSCTNGKICYDPKSRCNGWPDCFDLADEKGCDPSECDLGERQYCHATKKCLPPMRVCDGDKDCPTGTDEIGCGPNDCRGFARYCNSTETCSDGRRKCSDGTCADVSRFPCKTEDYCLPSYKRCNGHSNCADGSDELDCAPEDCQFPDLRHCPSSNTCRMKDRKCDDGTCEDDKWPCAGEDKCILRSRRCDGWRDCDNGSDELNCTAADCGDDRYFCAPTGKCSSKSSYWCNGRIDCQDKSDETNCGPRDCNIHTRYCASQKSRKCVSNVRQCADKTCAASWFACPSGKKCIPNYKRCDGKPDCGRSRRHGNADEKGCSPEDCQVGARFCNSTLTCEDKETKCSDGTCAEDYFACKLSSKCINTAFRCNGNPDCRAGDDEEGCRPEDCRSLAWEMRFCNDTETCIRKDQKCADGSCVLAKSTVGGVRNSKMCLLIHMKHLAVLSYFVMTLAVSDVLSKGKVDQKKPRIYEYCSFDGKPNVSEALSSYTMHPLLTPSLFPKVPPTINFVAIGQQVEPPHEKIAKYLKWYSLDTGGTNMLVKECLERSWFENTYDSNEWLGHHAQMFLLTETISIMKNLRPHQKCGVIPNRGQYYRKDFLALNIRRLRETHGDKEFNITPETFILPFEKAQLKAAWNKSSEEPKWIVKPAFSCCGRNVEVVHQWEQLDVSPSPPTVVQRYIDRPYLLDGKKNDLRLFVFIACLDPLRFYILDKGLVKLATVRYSNDVDSLNNKFVHLTNRAINKHHDSFITYKTLRGGFLWSLEPLWEHIQEKGGNPREVWENIKDVVRKTIISGEKTTNMILKSSVKSRTAVHEVYGFDIMLDDDLRPWILEVNNQIGLYRHSENVDGVVVKDMLNIAGFQIPGDAHIGTNGESKQDRRNFEFDDVKMDMRLHTYVLSPDENEKHAYYCKYANNLTIQSTILDVLTPDDVRVLVETIDEQNRRGDYEILFPSESDKYIQFLEIPRYYNLLLHQWTKRYKNREWQGVQLLQALCQKSIHLQNPTSDPKHKWTNPER